MSTFATIGIKNENGSVTAMQVKYDGGLWYVGKILHQYYTTEEAVRSLIKLGNIDHLYPTIMESNKASNHEIMGFHAPITTPKGKRWEMGEYNYLYDLECHLWLMPLSEIISLYDTFFRHNFWYR